MKIRASILRKNRTIDSIMVNPDRRFFDYKGGSYFIQKEYVNITSEDGLPSSFPELFYIEDDPFPISFEENEGSKALDEIILLNALDQLAGEPSEFLSLLMDYLRSPLKILLLVFALVIVYAVIAGGLF